METLTRDQGLSAIVDAAKNTGLCLFVGAGVSVGAGLPNFKTLVWKLAESIGKTREEFDAVSNLMVLTQEYFDLRNAVSLHNTIAEQFKQVNPRPTAVHAAFAKLKTHLKFIATTNYDNLLSTALSSSQNVKVIVDAADVATLNGAFGIFHIHGNIDRPGSLVITLQQYLKAKKNKQTLVQQLGALAARMPIVFVGYSASDWNIQEYIYEALESFGDFKSDHFAVNLNATLPEQKSVQISFKAIGVRTIDLAITDRNQYTTELANFFDDLANRLEGASTPKQTSDSVSVVVGETVDSVSVIVDKKMLHDDWVPTFPYDRISSHHWIPRDEVTPLINQLIERQRVGIVGVQGRGGIGKTALASHICQDLENKKLFPDGIVLIRMRSRTMRNCLDELAGIFNMHELNRNDLSLEDLQKRFIKKIHQKKLLIVLDNVEKGAELDPLLDLFGKANIAVLMTARSRLTSKISWTELPMLDETQSYELLLMHCKRLKIKPEAQVKAFEREYFRGLPLAIKLAGIYLQSHVTATMESLGKRMNDGVQVLDEAGQPDDVGKSVKACFDLSWIELTKDEQQIFIACAQTWGSHIPHEVLLGKVCKVMSMTSEVVNAAFDVLSNKGFLDHEETQDEGGAWSIHPILRSYGHEKAKQVGEIRDENGVSVASDIIDARLLLGFDLDEIDAKRKPFALPSKQSYLLETLEVCEIQKWTEEFHKILCHVDQELNNRGLWQQRKSWLLKALQLQPDEAQTAFYLKSIGETYARMGHKQLAIEYYKQAIVVYEILNDKAAIAWILHWMIYEVYDSNQVALVWEMSTEALWKNLAFGSRTGLMAYGGILRNLCEYGFIEQFGTDLISTKLLELSERIMISQGNAFNVGLSIKSSSSLAQMFGNHELAVAELQRLKMQCEKCDHPELLLIFQKQLLALMVKQSKPICDVLKVANEIRISARRLGESEADTYADYFESVAYFQMRDFEKGAQLIEKILSSARVNTDKSIDAHVVLAEQLIDIQDTVTAKTHLLLAESLAFRGMHPLDYARLDLLRAAIVLPIDVESAKTACQQAGAVIDFYKAAPTWLSPAIQRLNHTAPTIDWQGLFNASTGFAKQLPTSYCLPAILGLKNLPLQVKSRDGATMQMVPSGMYRVGLNHIDLNKKDNRLEIWLPPFYIDTHPVTNQQFNTFCDATQSKTPAHWEDGICPTQYLDYAVNNITVEQARAYANWAGKRLPTREEWLAAASGPDGWHYPWGNEPDERYLVEMPLHIFPAMDVHPLTTFDEKRFAELLEGSLSLSLEEKWRVVDAVPTLSQFQIDELIKVFEDERAEFEKLRPSEGREIEALEKSTQAQAQFTDRFGVRAVATTNDASIFGVRDTFGLILEMVDSLGEVLAAGTITSDDTNQQSLFNFVSAPMSNIRNASGEANKNADGVVANDREVRDYTLGFRCAVVISRFEQLQELGLVAQE